MRHSRQPILGSKLTSPDPAASRGPQQDHHGHCAHSVILTGTTSGLTAGSATDAAATAMMSSRKLNSKS